MKRFVARWIQKRLEIAMRAVPVVVLAGARQSGKSTLVRNLYPERRYVTLDDLDVLEQAQHDPDSLLVNPPLTIDEIQRAPELLLAIKRKVDAGRQPGDFLLTGSAQFALMRNVAESLAGRAVYLDLYPFCPMEWCEVPAGEELISNLFLPDDNFADWDSIADTQSWLEWAVSGGLAPALQLDNHDARSLWLGGYVQTYLERDLRDLSAVSSLPDFQRMMRIAALRTGRLVNQADIARDAALSHATCHRYLNLLETGFQIARLKPYATNPTTALVKSPKLFWSDSGVAVWLAGIGDSTALLERTDKGFWLEQAVFQTLQSWRGSDPFKRRLGYWRTRDASEVDFVIEKGGLAVAIEVKASGRVGLDDLKGLRSFAANFGGSANLVRSVVLYGGSECRFLGSDIVALPYAALFPRMHSLASDG